MGSPLGECTLYTEYTVLEKVCRVLWLGFFWVLALLIWIVDCRPSEDYNISKSGGKSDGPRVMHVMQLCMALYYSVHTTAIHNYFCTECILQLQIYNAAVDIL